MKQTYSSVCSLTCDYPPFSIYNHTPLEPIHIKVRCEFCKAEYLYGPGALDKGINLTCEQCGGGCLTL